MGSKCANKKTILLPCCACLFLKGGMKPKHEKTSQSKKHVPNLERRDIKVRISEGVSDHKVFVTHHPTSDTLGTVRKAPVKSTVRSSPQMGGRWCSYFSHSSPTAVKEKTMCAVAARPALLLVEKKHLEIKWDPALMLYLQVFCVTAGEQFNPDHQ